MAERCIEIIIKNGEIMGHVVDENENKLYPTKEERERIVDEIMGILETARCVKANKLLNDYTKVDEVSIDD